MRLLLLRPGVREVDVEGADGPRSQALGQEPSVGPQDARVGQAGARRRAPGRRGNRRAIVRGPGNREPGWPGPPRSRKRARAASDLDLQRRVPSENNPGIEAFRRTRGSRHRIQTRDSDPASAELRSPGIRTRTGSLSRAGPRRRARTPRPGLPPMSGVRMPAARVARSARSTESACSGRSRCRSIRIAESRSAVGLARSLPAISGAVP